MSEPLRALVVDDEPIVEKRLKPVLEKLGLEVETFGDPALALARFSEAPFDIVVTDVRMKGIGGLALLERVRELSPRCKVILITGYPSPEVAAAAMSKGAFDYLAKPLRTDRLREAVRRAAASIRQGKDASP